MKGKRIRNDLRRFRRESGLKQKDVAAILGLESSSMISRWEKGVCLPETIYAMKLAALYRSAVDVIYQDLRLAPADEVISRQRAICKTDGGQDD